jgi:hypothetical protein
LVIASLLESSANRFDETTVGAQSRGQILGDIPLVERALRPTATVGDNLPDTFKHGISAGFVAHGVFVDGLPVVLGTTP